MPAYDYDVLVVGAGQGGLPAAHMAANLGAKVALIEEREVGEASRPVSRLPSGSIRTTRESHFLTSA